MRKRGFKAFWIKYVQILFEEKKNWLLKTSSITVTLTCNPNSASRINLLYLGLMTPSHTYITITDKWLFYCSGSLSPDCYMYFSHFTAIFVDAN